MTERNSVLQSNPDPLESSNPQVRNSPGVYRLAVPTIAAMIMLASVFIFGCQSLQTSESHIVDFVETAGEVEIASGEFTDEWAVVAANQRVEES